MSSQNTAVTLKEILIGISDSLNAAQHQLRNAAPYDEYGRPNTLYTLPYLDFNLEVEAEVEQLTQANEATSNRMDRTAPYSQVRAAYAPMMKFKPITQKTVEEKKGNRITSSISGRFVAVMPNEGLPQLILEASPKATDTPGVYDIVVEVFNSAGEKIPGALVEFNYNTLKSELLSQATTMSHQTNFVAQSEVTSDQNGIAMNQLQIDMADYNAGHIIQIDINVGTVITKISIQKQ